MGQGTYMVGKVEAEHIHTPWSTRSWLHRVCEGVRREGEERGKGGKEGGTREGFQEHMTTIRKLLMCKLNKSSTELCTKLH